MINYKKMEKIYSALVTPINEDESVNYISLAELVKSQLHEGVEGFYCCGSSGEGLLLNFEERKKVLETVLSITKGDVPVISHVGTIRTADAVQLARHAKDSGADAIAMIPPYYYRFSMEEILKYYLDIIDSVPGFPCIIYNIPQFTGIEFTKQNSEMLLERKELIGIKHTSKDLYNLERFHSSYPNKILFNGFDEQFLGALSMGAKASIGTTVNLFAPLFLKVRSMYCKRNMEEALKVQRKINDIVETLNSVGIFKGTKYACTLKGIPCGNCRAPFKPLTEGQKAIIKRLMDSCL